MYTGETRICNHFGILLLKCFNRERVLHTGHNIRTTYFDFEVSQHLLPTTISIVSLRFSLSSATDNLALARFGLDCRPRSPAQKTDEEEIVVCQIQGNIEGTDQM